MSDLAPPSQIPINRTRNQGRWTLVAIAAIFALPIVVAWWLNVSPGALSNSTPHSGTLVPHAPNLDEGKLRALGGEPLAEQIFTDKWSLISINPDSQCKSPCTHALYVSGQVRLAMGREITRVQRVLVQQTGESDAVRSFLLATQTAEAGLAVVEGAPGWLTQVKQVLPTNAALDEYLYVADPQGRLVVFYPLSDDPKGLIKDLKRLLRYSKIG
ncbi:MAG: hypothetical protein ACI9W2_000772 [Gammaproteobacteria bacterium]|jgi:hypothetical protein